MAIRERFWMFFMSLYKYILGIKDEFWIYLERKKQKDMILCFFLYFPRNVKNILQKMGFTGIMEILILYLLKFKRLVEKGLKRSLSYLG